jgi:hypothetical protein
MQHAIWHCRHHLLLLLLLLEGQGGCQAHHACTAVWACTIPLLLLLLLLQHHLLLLGGFRQLPAPLSQPSATTCALLLLVLLLLEVQLRFELQELLLGEGALLLAQGGPAIDEGLHAQGYGAPAAATPRLGAAAAGGTAGAHAAARRAHNSSCSRSRLGRCNRTHRRLLLLLLLLSLHAAAVDVGKQLVVDDALHIHCAQHVTRGGTRVTHPGAEIKPKAPSHQAVAAAGAATAAVGCCCCCCCCCCRWLGPQQGGRC